MAGGDDENTWNTLHEFGQPPCMVQDKDALKRSPHRWLRQAEADLQAAHDSAQSNHFDSACFQSQQAGEKALKALLYLRGVNPRKTHDVLKLLEQAEKFESDLSNLREEAAFLDTLYLPTRYPDELDSDLAPADYFDQRAFQPNAFQNDAFQTKAVNTERALSCAQLIRDAVARCF